MTGILNKILKINTNEKMANRTFIKVLNYNLR